MLHPCSLASVALTAMLFGCAGAPTPAPTHTHTHTATVTVTERGLTPAPAVSIPTFATIVWRNSAKVPLTIDVTAASCHQCDTVMGFVSNDTGARSAAVAPGGITTLCFHDVGTFAYVARLGDAAHEGVIHVGGAP